MRREKIILVVPAALSLALLTLSTAPARAAPEAPRPTCPTGATPDVGALIGYTQAVLEGSRSMKGTMAMTIKTPSYTRKLKLALSTKGDAFALIRVIEGGPREVGMMTLKRDKQLWNYLPQAGRVMKLPSGMLGDSWMGSDFTNDDLVKGSSLSKDFSARLDGATPYEGKDAWRVTLVPKKDAVVVWGRIEVVIEKANCLPLEQRFYDEDNKLARKMTFGAPKQVGWRLFPSRTTVTPSDTGKQTTVEYLDVAFDVDIPDDTFSVHRLQQGR